MNDLSRTRLRFVATLLIALNLSLAGLLLTVGLSRADHESDEIGVPEAIYVSESGQHLYDDAAWCSVVIPDLTDFQLQACVTAISEFSNFYTMNNAPASLQDGVVQLLVSIGFMEDPNVPE